MKMKQTIWKRITSLMLVWVLLVSMIPAALADETGIKVTFEQESISMKVGEKKTLKARVIKDGAEITGASVIYTSRDAERAKISESGEVEALAVGSVTIVAIYEAEGKKTEGICQITVTEAASGGVTALSVIPNVINEPQEIGGKDFDLTVTGAGGEAVNWYSTDESVVTVSRSETNPTKGLVKMVGPGTASVYAQAANGVKSKEVVFEVSGLILKPSLEMLTSRSDTLTLGRYGRAKDTLVTWSSSNISVANVKEGKISAYNPGSTIIKAEAGRYSASCTVTVKEDVAASMNHSMKVGDVFSFTSILSELNSLAQEELGKTPEYLTGLYAAPSQGIIHYGYKSPDIPGSGVGSSERYYLNASSSQRDLDDVSFVPASDFGGTAIISYTACADGQSFVGTIRIAVENSGDVAYNTAEGRLLPLETEDFILVCKRKTGRALRYLTFKLPAESKGTLYYNYSSSGQFSQRVSESSSYYVTGGSLLLEKISFMPAEGYKGTLEIPYYATDSSGATYTGAITIQVFGAGGEKGETPDIVYQASAGHPVDFDSDDFYDVCDEVLDSGLNYVYFKQPGASAGMLYYDYSSSDDYGNIVSENTRYFEDSSPRISRVSFVPNADHTGTITIPYTGYGNSGSHFEGKILIQVSGGVGTIEYSTRRNQEVDFDGLDFNEACVDNCGVALGSIKFSLPSSREGVLYYNYSESRETGTKVKEANTYSVNGISKITFVPKRGYTGTVSIPFSGWDDNGGRFDGTVEILVESTSNWNDTVSYSGLSGGTISFKAEDFNNLSKLETGYPMDYVRFTLPDVSCGVLREGGRDGAAVNEYDNYYRSGSTALLDNVVFVARSGYTGEVTIPYTGRSTGGDIFQGTVEISVSAPKTSKVEYTGSSLPVRFTAQSFRDACVGLLPNSLSYVQFDSLPNEVYGKLIQNYSKPNGGTKVTAGSRFYNNGSPAIDGLAFVPQMGYEGTVTIPYTAADIKGTVIEGTLRITVSNRYLPNSFTDTANYGWAKASIEFLRDGGVINGYGDGRYGPADRTGKGAFTLMVCRLFNLPQQTGENFVDVAADSPYAKEILTAKVLGIADGVAKKEDPGSQQNHEEKSETQVEPEKNHFYPESAITREQAIVMLVRAMKAAGQKIQAGSPALLSAYNDGDKVSADARSAMASMIQMGIITGDTEGRLNPGNSITRAEIAVILHKVLTM